MQKQHSCSRQTIGCATLQLRRDNTYVESWGGDAEATNACPALHRSSDIAGVIGTWWRADIYASLAAECQRWMVAGLLVTDSLVKRQSSDCSASPKQQSASVNLREKQFTLLRRLWKERLWPSSSLVLNPSKRRSFMARSQNHVFFLSTSSPA